MSCYELREAVRLARSAVKGSPWTGNFDKHEVQRAVRRLIEVAESLDRENARLIEVAESLDRENARLKEKRGS